MSTQALHLIAENIRTKNPVLDLGRCGLTELYPELLEELAKTGEWLETLILSNNWWDWTVREWRYSQNKGEANQIIMLPALPPLPQLKIAILANLGANNCTPLAALTGLQTLYISGNQIDDCTPLAALTGLQTLYIYNNQIADCKPLAALTALQKLNISSNQIADCKPLAALTALQTLDISYNRIDDCKPLAALTALQTLDIYNNQIADCKPLAALTALQKLNISSNQIADCKPLAALTGLQTLYISDNRIDDCTPLAALTGLQTLDISDNRIANFSFEVLDELMKLQDLKLAGNPIVNIDKAVYNKAYTNVLQEVKDYINGIRKGSTAVYASKLILVGNGRVGKTCLLKRWLYKTFDPDEPSTHAIQLHPYKLDELAIASQLESLQLNIWDFGGQHIYHATHRVFLNTQALFLLVWDKDTEAKPEQSETLPNGAIIVHPTHQLRYWLSYIKALSKNSPVILVETKTGIKYSESTPPGISEEDKEHFNIRYVLGVESERAMANGFTSLQEKVETLVYEQILQECTQLPTTWYKVRQQIETWRDEKVKQIPMEEYVQLCRDNELDSSSTQTLLQYLHDTGTLFYREGLFGNQLVIDQQWAINAVYALFYRKGFFFDKINGRGFFTGQDLQLAWMNYTIAEQELFVSFMQSCKVCVEINPARYDEPKKPFTERQFLAPQLLPTDAHNIKWVFYGVEKRVFPCLLYKAHFLHAAIIQEMIVQLAFLSEENNMWVNGILIKTNKGMALIEADENRKELKVQLHPDARLDLLEILKQAIDKVVRYDTDMEVSLSLDGKTFVNKKAIAQLPPGNTQVQDDTNHWVSAEPYRSFWHTGRKDTAEENPLATLQPVAPQAEIFFSYAWKDESNPKREKMVDALYESLVNDGYNVKRDKKNIEYGGLISEFMEAIGEGQHIFIFLSDKYIRSSYCMYELYLAYLQCAFNTDKLKGKIYPIRLEQLDLLHTDTYMDEWLKKKNYLESFIEKYGFASSKGKRDELDKVNEIYPKIDPLLTFLNDINASTPKILSKDNFEPIKQIIQQRMQQNK